MFSAIGFIENEGENFNIQRKQLRDYSNPLELPDYDFQKHFWVNKEIFLVILDIITPHIRDPQRCTFIPVTLKLAAFLNFLGTGSYQNGVGNNWLCMFSQPVVSKTIAELLDLFEEQGCPKYIILVDTMLEETATKEYFFENFHIPGVVGCIDGMEFDSSTNRIANNIRNEIANSLQNL